MDANPVEASTLNACLRETRARRWMSTNTRSLRRVRRIRWNPSSMPELAAMLACTAILVGGLALLAAAYWQVGRHIQSASWVAAPAVVLEIGEDYTHDLRTGFRMWTRRFVGKLEYEHEGQRYVTERLGFSHTRDRSLDDWWPNISQQLGREGNVVSVWVNPRDPTDAVFVRDVRWAEVAIMLGFGGLLTFVGGHFLMGTPMGAPGPAPEFSWRVVGSFAVVGACGLVLTPLLWRDGHPAWAVTSALPALLAMIGVYNGLRGA